MKKGIKKGALVTGYAWEHGKRIYGHIICYLGENRWAVKGKWGLREFYGTGLRLVSKESDHE